MMRTQTGHTHSLIPDGDRETDTVNSSQEVMNSYGRLTGMANGLKS
jgi:hypothetical protein